MNKYTELQNGWYRVTLKNNEPAEDEVSHYDEWVEYNDGWRIEDLPNHEVIRVIKQEMGSNE